MKNNSKNKTNHYLNIKVAISENTSLMFLAYFSEDLADSSTIKTMSLTDQTHKKSTMTPALLICCSYALVTSASRF